MNRFARIRELFEAAVDKAPDARAGFLRDACAGDDELRLEVESLLANDTDMDDPLAASVCAVAEDRFDTVTPWLGRRIGSYRIVAELGRGGMGSVFLAERADDEYRSQVAIKLIRGFPTPEALERLRRERQVLAGLVHANIARLLDGGTTAGGPAVPRHGVRRGPADDRAGLSKVDPRWCAACVRSASCAVPCTMLIAT